MADAGFRLTVEGEKEFRKAIGDVNAILRLNQAELQKVTAEYNASEKGIEDMSRKQEELGAVIQRQTDAVAQMEGELERLTESYGENDKGVIKMRTELDKAKASLAGMQAQFKASSEEIERAAKTTDGYTESMEDIDAQIKAFAAEIKAMDEGMNNANGTMSIFGRNADETGKQVEDLKKKGELLTSMIDEQKKKMDTLNDEMEEAVKLYGSQSREVAEYRTEIANATTDLQDMEKQLEDNNDKIDEVETGAGDLSGVFEKISDITGIEIPDGLKKMVGGIDGATAAAGGLVTLLVSAAKGYADIHAEVLEENTEINKMAENAGITASEVQELTFVAEKYHVEVDSIIDTLKDLRNNMYEASEGNEELQTKFRELGVEISDQDGLRSALAVYMELSDVWKEMDNETERLAAMSKILGESVNQSASVAAAGTDQLQKLINEAWKYGYAYSDAVNESLKEQQTLIDDLSMRWEGLKNKIAVFGTNYAKQAIGGDDGKFGIGDALRYISGGGNLWNTVQALLTTSNQFKATPYSGGEGSSGGTVNNYNITIPASDIKEFNDIVNVAQNARVAERRK